MSRNLKFAAAAEMGESPTALSGLAYEKVGAMFPSVDPPTPVPTPMASERLTIERNRFVELANPPSLLHPDFWTIGQISIVRLIGQ
jgi:hypothetical protein